MKGALISGAFAAALGMSGCASAPSSACGSTERPILLDTFYFGTVTSGEAVTPEQWKNFLNEVVTPRFPRGLTWWEASGQWQTAAGATQQEASHLLQIVHPESRDDTIAFREIMSRYKARFRQEAVLRVRAHACLSR